MAKHSTIGERERRKWDRGILYHNNLQLASLSLILRLTCVSPLLLILCFSLTVWLTNLQKSQLRRSRARLNALLCYTLSALPPHRNTWSFPLLSIYILAIPFEDSAIALPSSPPPSCSFRAVHGHSILANQDTHFSTLT